MRKNNRALYEQIMRNIAKQVKIALNESFDEDEVNDFDSESFSEVSMTAYRAWLKNSENIVRQLKKEGELEPGMDFYDALDVIEDNLTQALNKAVGGNWWSIGRESGCNMDYLWNDKMQAKTDCIEGIEDEDEDDLIDDEPDENPMDQNIFEEMKELVEEKMSQFNSLRKQVKYPKGTEPYIKRYINYIFNNSRFYMTIDGDENFQNFTNEFYHVQHLATSLTHFIQFGLTDAKARFEPGISLLPKKNGIKCNDPHLLQILNDYDVLKTLTLRDKDPIRLFERVIEAFQDFVNYLNANL